MKLYTAALAVIFLACGQSAPLHGLATKTGGTMADAAPSGTGGEAKSGGDIATGGSASGGSDGSGGAILTGGTVATPTGGTTVISTGGTDVINTGGTDVISTGGTDVISTGGTDVISTGGTTSVSFPHKFVGNIDAHIALPEDFASYWDQLTPETAGRWIAVQGVSQDLFNWSTLDALYAYAEQHNLVFKEHNFIWGSSDPSWQSRLNKDTAPAALKAWMKAFCDRYPKTRLIDVVNEPPPHTTPMYVNYIGGGTKTTWDWIANAFTWAREACPNAILLLNDYNNVEITSDVQNTIAIVQAIQKLNAPIDAIGCQAHDTQKLSAKTVKANIDKIVAATGLPIYITEFDIGLTDDEQKLKYAEHFPMLWDHPAVKGITIWGYIVGTTWRNNTGLMNSDGTMRPAMSWLMDFLATNRR